MAAAGMYKMKPFYGGSEVVEEYRTCMYKMKNIHGDSVEELTIDDPELLKLIDRQASVLKELEKLKDEVHQIGIDIGLNSQSQPAQTPSARQPPTSTGSTPCNIVIKASPDDPPLSVYLLHQLAQQSGLDCSLKSHIHCSLPGQIPEELFKLFNPFSNKNTDICIRFIWKDNILTSNLMVSAANQSPILGEVNILRYLARVFQPHLYSNQDPLQVTTIDDWLNSTINLNSSKDVKIFMQNLNTHLGKHTWLAGNALSIADICCSTAILKHNHGSQVPKNVSKWIAQLRKGIPGFEQVENLCK